MKVVECELTFTEEMLGTKPGTPDVFAKYIASKREAGIAKDEINAEENSAALADEAEIRGTTIFHKDANGNPFIWDYMIKGFFKDSCSALAKADNSLSSGIRAFKKAVDGLIFVSPRKIPCVMPPDSQIGVCERPLRAQTMKGERVTLARSETIPAGTKIKFTVTLLSESLYAPFMEWMAYGQLRGLGQWRNSGKGRFISTCNLVKGNTQVKNSAQASK